MKIAVIAVLLLFTGFSWGQVSIDKELDLKWKTKIGLTSFRTNITYTGKYIVVASNGEQRNVEKDEGDGVYIIDPESGEIVHQINPEGDADQDCNGVAVYKNRLYFGNDNRHFYCYDLESGERIWKFRIPMVERLSMDVESVPVLMKVNEDEHPDLVFTVEGYGLFALDGQNGNYLWDYEYAWGDGTYMSSPAAVDLNDDGYKDLIFGGKRPEDPELRWDYQNALFAVNGKSGSPIWSYQTGSNIHASPLVVKTNDGVRIVVAESFSTVSILNESGNVLRYASLNIEAGKLEGAISGLFSSPVLNEEGKMLIGTSWWGDGDGVWFADMNEVNFRVDAASGIPALDSEFKQYTIAGQVSASAVVADVLKRPRGQEMAILTENGELIVFTDEGEVAERFILMSGGEATPFVGNIDGDRRNELLIATYDGMLYCYDLKTKKEPFWGSFRGGGNNDGVMELDQF